MNKDEALRLALEAMEENWFPLTGHTAAIKNKVIAAIKQALEQPIATNDTSNNRVDETAKQRHEPEAVAFYVYKPTLPRGHLGNVSDGDLPWVYDQDPSSGYSARMLVYTSPPKREPLTDEQKDILNFLLGASDIDDAWFGDKHPTEKGQFWWRNRLRKAFQVAAHGIKGEA